MLPIKQRGDGADPYYKIRPMDKHVGPMTEHAINIYEARLIISALGQIAREESKGTVRWGRIREYNRHTDKFTIAASREASPGVWKPFDKVLDGDEVAAHVRFFRMMQGVAMIVPLRHKLQKLIQKNKEFGPLKRTRLLLAEGGQTLILPK